MNFYAEKEQDERRSRIAAAAAAYTMHHYDEKGSWIGSSVNAGLREQLWFSAAYLQEGSAGGIKLANRILQNNLPKGGFCHFSPFVCLQIIAHFSELLEEETIRCIDGYVLRWIDEAATPEMEFIGRNDNFPCLAAAALTLGGQRYGRGDLTEKAREQMRQFALLLTRRGFPSEYTSPTYTPIQLIPLAEMVNLAEDAELRELALQAEIRVWTDILMHLYWPAAQMAGAFSRGYTVDALACTHHARFAYYMLYGEELTISPMDTVMSGREVQQGHVAHHDADFLKISFMWQALPRYHCPAELAEWAKNRTYPYTCIGTAESASGAEYRIPSLPEPSSPLPFYYEMPAHVNVLTCYMTEDYAIGTSRFSFLNGWMSHNVNLLYRKKEAVTHQRDIGNVFVRYVINEHMLLSGSGEYFDMGNCVTMQKENTAVALYNPRILHDREIYSLKLTVNITALYGGPDEIWIGERKLPGLEGQSALDEAVFVRDGDIYMMFMPLITAPPDRNTRCRIRRREHLTEIAFYNYEGERKDFDRMELLRNGNGVAVEIRSKKEEGSFEAFRRHMKPKIMNRWFRMIRECRYENNGTVLQCEYSTISRSIRFAAADDELILEPRLYSSQAIEGLTFLNTK